MDMLNNFEQPEIAEEGMDNPAIAENSESPSGEPVVDEKGRTPEQSSYWQAKYDKETAEYKKQLEELRNEVTSIKNPPKQEERIEKPIKPIRPANFNLYDATNDPDSDSYRFNEMMITYQEKLADYNERKMEAFEQERLAERQQREQELQMQEAKKSWINQFVSAGLSPQEAAGAYDFYTREENKTPKAYADFYKWSMQNNRPQGNKNMPPIPGSTVSGGIQQMTKEQSYREEERRRRDSFIL